MNLMNLFNNIKPKEVLQYLPDAVFVVKEQSGEIIWINEKAAHLFEITREDLDEINFNEIVDKGLELADKSSRKDVPIIGGALTKSGEFFIELNATLLDDEYFITVRDVTAMTNVLVNAEKTGRLNKDKNLMLSKLSHEFKSPVQSILGFSTALTDGLGGEINPKQQKYVKIINKNANELLYFMDKFFEFSNVESSLTNFTFSTFDIINLVQGVIKNNEIQLKTKNLSININDENLLNKTVYSDENALKTILQNIIELSINLTEVGSITIELNTPELEFVEKTGIKLIKGANDKSYIQISIIDNGVGLQENEKEGIFEPYTQVDKLNKKNIVRSFCLGTAKELVKHLNGSIWLATEVMKGTVFNVILPVEKGAVQQDE
ncbi:MAG: hypothetical protein KH301_07235 [Brachyspira sp.]|nr:hypothetical protein [Brachyspira sp.]